MTTSVKQSWRLITGRVLQLIPRVQDVKAIVHCLYKPLNLPTCLRRQWTALPVIRRHFIVSLILGLCVTVSLHAFHRLEVLAEMEDKAMDWVMTLWEGGVTKEPVIPFGWIDIDERTYLKWNEPLYVPRVKLASLINFALQSHPKMVVIDIDLAKRDHDRKIDEPVIKVLNKYTETCKNKPLSTDSCPPVVLLASLRIFEPDLPLQRASYLDDLVEGSNHLFWASPLFEKDRDQIIRRWRIWESVRRESGSQIMALPSLQLLAATLLTTYDGSVQRLQSCLDAKALKGYTPTSEPKNSSEAFMESCVSLWERLNALLDQSSQRSNELLTFSSGRVARRIVYTIPWQKNVAGLSNKRIPTVETIEHEERLILSRVPSYTLDDGVIADGRGDLEGRVVFIGGSFRDSRDIYLSPLGEMPGVLVIINAMHSLLQHGEIEEITLAHKIVINLLLIALLSIIFSAWNLFWGKVIVGLTIIVMLVPISVYMFGFGYWVDFALPLLAVQIYQLIAKWGQTAHGVITGEESQSGKSG